jgi:hypothetical protein
LGVIGLVILLAGCATKPETDADETTGMLASLRDNKPNPDFDTTGADCAGRLYRDAEQAVSGVSQCKNGATVSFYGRSSVPLAEYFFCDYALSYTGPKNGNGRLACSDGSTGDFVFEETIPTHGTATAHLKDGREITLIYTQDF